MRISGKFPTFGRSAIEFLGARGCKQALGATIMSHQSLNDYSCAVRLSAFMTKHAIKPQSPPEAEQPDPGRRNRRSKSTKTMFGFQACKSCFVAKEHEKVNKPQLIVKKPQKSGFFSAKSQVGNRENIRERS